METFTLIHISDSDKHFKVANQEYIKRIGSGLEIITIKPTKHGTKKQIIKKETDHMIEKINKKIKKSVSKNIYLLSIHGKNLTTEEFSTYIPVGSSSVFLIGGPYGVDEARLLGDFPSIKRISFGKQTMPHGLAKLVLFEQIYRAQTIQKGKTYHY